MSAIGAIPVFIHCANKTSSSNQDLLFSLAILALSKAIKSLIEGKGINKECRHVTTFLLILTNAHPAKPVLKLAHLAVGN
jgi:hypothetical protein